jgi:ribonucleotide reductase alpha subunit
MIILAMLKEEIIALILLLVCIVPILLLSVFAIFKTINNKSKLAKKHELNIENEPKDLEQQKIFYNAYGGKENIIEISLKVSRITVKVRNIEKVNAPIVDNYIKLHPECDINNLPDIFVSAMELSAEEHADVQCVIQRWVDSSISKTVNAPKGYTVEDVEKLYMRLYKGKAKGGTVYVDGSRDTQVLTLKKEDTLPKQVELSDLGIEIQENKVERGKDEINPTTTKANRNIGVEVGDTCPICLQGVVEDIGGCNTCTNCNAQLKCGL